jgi:hypothetical protein
VEQGGTPWRLGKAAIGARGRWNSGNGATRRKQERLRKNSCARGGDKHHKKYPGREIATEEERDGSCAVKKNPRRLGFFSFFYFFRKS